jgi:hypothetical protein
MASEPQPEGPVVPDAVEMPRPTVAPLVLALGLTLLAAGVAFGPGFLVVGALVVVAAISLWIVHLLPGRGHVHEPVAEPVGRPQMGAPGGVEHMRPGQPGYRLRLPQDVHPISAGLKGGLLGAAVMPVPALLWGLFSSAHSLWYPINLLAGMALAVPANMDAQQLDEYLKSFHGSLLLVAICIHIVISLVIGLIYGVLLPTLPEVPRSIAWGGLFMPIFWTGVSYLGLSTVSPRLPAEVNWPWFLVSQLVFGITMPAVVLGARGLPRLLAGVVGGLVGGAVMALPAVLWSAASGRGFWYPINVLAGLIRQDVVTTGLGQFHADWFLTAAAVHAVLSITFGVWFALLAPRLPNLPAPLAWGGLILPLVWTGISYGLMGVVNPVLQDRVDWAWFIVSQFIFGVAVAVVVLRSATVAIPPAGRGPDRVADFVTGPGGGQS